VVRGVDLLGQPFEERTATQVLSFHGCRYASKHHLPKNTWITIEVPASHGQRDPLRVRARVAWVQRPRTLRELFNVGVELETGANIWGVEIPPEDWSRTQKAGAVAGTIFEVTSSLTSAEDPRAGAGQEQPTGPLDAYLERMLAESVRVPGGIGSVQSSSSSRDYAPMLREMREHFDAQARQVLEEARAHAEQLVHDRAAELQKDLHSELRTELKKEQRLSAEAFYQRWREEFEREQAGATEQVSSALAHQVATQVSEAQAEVRAKLKAEWESGIEQARAALAEWRRQAETFQEEARSISEALAGRAEQRMEEKLAKQLTALRQELVSSGMAVPVAGTSLAENPAELLQTLRARLDSEMAVTRAQWSELLESSLDNAAQKLVERLAENSQRVLQSAELTLAARVAELEQESGRSSETARDTLEEVKSAFEREVKCAKSSLEEIEKAAAHFTDYSRQLEAASQDGMNELRKRLEATLASNTAEMDKRAAELLKQVSERAGQMLEQTGQQAAMRAAADAASRIAPSIERAAEASRQLEAREHHAEEILRVHRERLRQVSEQTQRDASEQASTTLTNLRNDFEAARKNALANWFAELEASGARVANEASASLANAAEWQVQEAASRLKMQALESLQRAQDKIEEMLKETAGRYPAKLESIETESLHNVRERLRIAAGEQLESLRMEFAKAAEAAVAECTEKIQKNAGEALGHFSVESNAKAEQGRTRLVAAAEQVLQSFQGHAQDAVGHLQEQIAATMDQNMRQSQELLAAQLVATFDSFQNQGDAQVGEWSAKLEAMSAGAFERHEDRLRSAAESWVDTSLRQLEAVSQTRMDALIRTTQEAMRKACVMVFDGIAQAMKEQLPGALTDSRNATQATVSEMKPPERRASA
jgi:hypothetical protein